MWRSAVFISLNLFKFIGTELGSMITASEPTTRAVITFQHANKLYIMNQLVFRWFFGGVRG